MSSRSASSLWVQLINGGALPLEALLLLLVLAGADPGPLPALERLLAWGLGAAAPALLLWKRPGDPPALQVGRIALATGVVLLLPLLVWLDRTAALAYPLSPLQGADRLICLLAASALLALMLWQWQQLVQAIWLLSRHQPVAAAAASDSGTALTVEPEQPAEHSEGTDLDQDIS